MGQIPRWYRKQQLEHKLEHVLKNPMADISQVQAAKEAIEKKLEQQDRDYHYSQTKQVDKYMEQL